MPQFCCLKCKVTTYGMLSCAHCGATSEPDLRLRFARSPSTVDPWVVVGTTTIDGTLAQVADLIQCEPDREPEDLLDAFARSPDPWMIGGRHLRAKNLHINGHARTALIRCDIVRRQSEIDAEKKAREQTILDGLMRVHMSNHECPECGPHGNAGRVLLLESWVDCETCRPREIIDVVPPRAAITISADTGWAEAALSSSLIAEGASQEVAQQGVRAFMDALERSPEMARRHVPLEGVAATYAEGDRVVDRWGRKGVVVTPDNDWPRSIRVKMDAGWTGIFCNSEIVGKADE